MSSTYRAFLSKMGGTNPVEYVGRVGEIFWDPNSGSLRLSDGTTAGGVAIPGLSNGFQARNNTPAVTTSLLASGNYEELNVTGHEGYVLYSITADKPCWVRVYDSVLSRTADLARSPNVPPTANSGLIGQAIFTFGGKINFTPGLFGYSGESVPNTTIPITVSNTDPSTAQAITVTLNVLKLEQ